MTVTYTKAYTDRVQELRSLPWSDIKDAAELVDHVKPDDEKWSEQAEAIAAIEFTINNLAIEEPAVTGSDESQSIAEPEASEPEQFPVAYYRAIGVTIGSDGDKIKTDLNGNIIN